MENLTTFAVCTKCGRECEEITPHKDNEWKEEFDIKVPGYSMQDIDSPVKVPIMVQRQDAIDFIEKTLSSQAHTLKEQMKEKVKNMKVYVFIAVTDNDGHRYQIPTEKREEWYKWTEIPSADPESWDVPEYAERIDGMDVKQPDFREQTLSAIESIEI